MNSRYIKLVAVVVMTIDHVGLLLYPEADWLRAVGRIAMPLFCLLIAYGVTKTRNVLKYFLRLFVFAVVVQVIFDVSMGYRFFGFDHVWNVFFTLSFGVAAASLINTTIMFVKDKSEMLIGRFLAMAATFLGALLVIAMADFFPIDYGSAGVLLVVLFYLALRHSVLAMKITAAASLAVFNIILHFAWGWAIQWWAFLALPFILAFVNRKLKITAWEKYAFYIYYPLHFVVIYFISFGTVFV